MSDASMIGTHVFTVCEDKTRIDDDNVVISVYDGKLGTQFGPGLTVDDKDRLYALLDNDHIKIGKDIVWIVMDLMRILGPRRRLISPLMNIKDGRIGFRTQRYVRKLDQDVYLRSLWIATRHAKGLTDQLFCS